LDIDNKKKMSSTIDHASGYGKIDEPSSDYYQNIEAVPQAGVNSFKLNHSSNSVKDLNRISNIVLNRFMPKDNLTLTPKFVNPAHYKSSNSIPTK